MDACSKLVYPFILTQIESIKSESVNFTKKFTIYLCSEVISTALFP